VGHRSSGQGIQAAHPLFIVNDHKGSAGPAELVVQRSAFQPLIQRWLTALKVT
jgi:hypothetical protein